MEQIKITLDSATALSLIAESFPDRTFEYEMDGDELLDTILEQGNHKVVTCFEEAEDAWQEEAAEYQAGWIPSLRVGTTPAEVAEQILNLCTPEERAQLLARLFLSLQK